MGNSDANHQIMPMPFTYDKVSAVMDEDTYKWHHDTHYAGYVNKRNEIEAALKTADLSKANANYSAYRAFKLEETWNANGAILHELYWSAMGGDGKPDESIEVVKKIIEDFGSFDAWKNDFIACGKVSRGWAVLKVDASTDAKLRNVLFDFHNVGGFVGSFPLLVLDVYEHAYYHKFGPDRASYLTAFVGNIDWKKVNDRYLMFIKNM
ncbi:Superoxide dismutase [Mn] 1 [uncultured archaeon]|nr:Superoxide dismutase [Mn] 1 [uncultured archaeon]